MRIFLGVDLAGDGGNTGVAEILEQNDGLRYRFPKKSWKRQEGLKSIAACFRRAEKTAVDHPFAYPMPCMRWYLGQKSPRHSKLSHLWRKTDKEMQERLMCLIGRKAAVQQPSRCANMWRAVALAELLGVNREEVCAGTGRLFETHPGVAWALVLASLDGGNPDLVRDYKGKAGKNQEIRKAMLQALEQGARLNPSSIEQRTIAWESDDNLDALMCAFVAYLSAHRSTELCVPARTPRRVILLEGVAVVPRRDWCAG